MSVQDDLQELKKKDWADSDRSLIAEWEKSLYDLHNDIEYLNMQQTQRIVNLLKRSVEQIDKHINEMESLHSNQFEDVNEKMIIRFCFRELLKMFKVDADLEGQKSQIELQIFNALKV